MPGLRTKVDEGSSKYAETVRFLGLGLGLGRANKTCRHLHLPSPTALHLPPGPLRLGVVRSGRGLIVNNAIISFSFKANRMKRSQSCRLPDYEACWRVAATCCDVVAAAAADACAKFKLCCFVACFALRSARLGSARSQRCRVVRGL